MRGLPLPFGLLGFGNGVGRGHQVHHAQANRRAIASTVQPAWHLTSARPSSPSPIESLPAGLRGPGSVPTIPWRLAWRPAASPAAVQRASSLPPFANFGLPAQPGLQVGHGVEHGLPFAVPDPRQGIGPRGAVSPQRVRGLMPRAFAASRGRRASDSTGCVAIVICSNDSLAANRGLHNSESLCDNQNR